MSVDSIKKSIQRIAQIDSAMDRAVVKSVDKNELTCVVIVDSTGLVLNDVLLKPVLNDNDLSKMGLILFPAVDSYVIIGQIDGDQTDQYVISCTEIESIGLDTSTALKLLIAADGNLSLNAVKMTFNNGLNGGLPLLKPLATAIQKIQKQLNDLGSAFKAHTHPVVGAATGITVTPSPSALAITKASDLENKAILQ